MANYYATTRSNYFRVKDATAFEAWCRMRDLEFWTHEVKGMGTCYAISGNETGWPYYDAEKDDEINLPAEIAGHLDPMTSTTRLRKSSGRASPSRGRSTDRITKLANYP
jgi:hypothetical protein